MTPLSQGNANAARTRSAGPSRARRLALLVAALVTMALTASLGVWQLRRAAQKTELADAMRSRSQTTALQSVPKSNSLQGDGGAWHRPIELRGTWMPQFTVYLDNRQQVVRGQARVGFDVVTPLRLSDGTAVLVQRGWVARNFMERQALTPIPTTSEPVLISGHYAPAPPRLFEFKQGEAPQRAGASFQRLRQNIDMAEYASEINVGLQPGSVVQTNDDEASGVLARAWRLPDVGVAKHHGYAFQWFGLCALVALLLAWYELIAPAMAARANARRHGAGA